MQDPATSGMGDGEGKPKRGVGVAGMGESPQLNDEVQVVAVVWPPLAPKHSVLVMQSAEDCVETVMGEVPAAQTRYVKPLESVLVLMPTMAPPLQPQTYDVAPAVVYLGTKSVLVHGDT